ncbi:MAG: hypothetical protein EPO12_22015 [Aquabacterium sp.]|jgi:hypothetical protein|nr:MAG: hypothetical protein EPO12_22015 [Aquabacterium sp.]
MMKNIAFAAIVVLNAYFASLSIADAADSGASAPSGQPPAPPEAVAACQGQAAGTTVSFTGRRGDTLTGTCETLNGVLAARPNFGGGKPPSRH